MVNTHLDYQQKVGKISNMLDEIISNQISSLNKSGLGYESDNNGNNSMISAPTHEASTGSFANVLRSPIKEKDNIKSDQQSTHVNKGAAQSIIPLISRYQTIFLGHCYLYYNFGHKATNCK